MTISKFHSKPTRSPSTSDFHAVDEMQQGLGKQDGTPHAADYDNSSIGPTPSNKPVELDTA